MPGRRRLLINLAADIGLYPWANLQVVQNPTLVFWQRNCHYLPLWPQPGLKSRIPSGRFKNISFLGAPSQFASEFGKEEWNSRVNSLGLIWIPRIESFQYNDSEKYRMNDSSWTDLTEIDAVVAVRRFTKYPAFDHKPPSKLVNCWLAGIPAILGAESAYRALYRSELDYIEVHSPEEVLAALVRLRDNPRLREAMIANGARRSKEVCNDAIMQRWIQFLEGVAIPSYHCWVAMSAMAQKMWLAENRCSMMMNRLRRKISTSPQSQ
jgi:hypothetical protein